MKIRRLGSALAAVAMVTVLAVAVPSAATAATPVDPVTPYAEYPDLVTEYFKPTTNAPLGSQAYAEQQAAARAWLEAQQKAAAGDATAAKVVAAGKPITAPGVLSRTAGGVGVALSGLQLGWMIGQVGLGLTVTASGGSYSDLICSGTTPDWYRAVNGYMMLGAAPECSVAVAMPNADQLRSMEISGGGASASAVGIGAYNGVCFHAVFVSGLSIRVKVGTNTGVLGGSGSYCSSFPSANAYYPYFPDQMDIYRPSDGTVLTTATPTRPNPERQLGCTITWSDGTTTSGQGSRYRETDGIVYTVGSTGCNTAYGSKGGGPSPGGGGVWPAKIDVKSTVGGVTSTVSSQTVPAFTAEQKAALLPASDNGGGLVLQKVVNGVTDSCMTWAADCSAWWTETSHGTVPTTGTTTYRCTMGGRVVSLTQCAVYQNTFSQQTTTPTITDPATGTEVEWGTTPSPANSTDPGVNPSPGDTCMSDWPSAANPVDWVLHPVKCALVWAFVPRTSVLTQVQTQIADAWAPTIVGKLPGIVDAAIVIPDGGTGCTGPVVDIPIHFAGVNVDYHGYPLSACAEPMSTLAGWARLIGSAILIWATGLGIIRRASAIVNAPGVGGGAS